VGTEWVWVIVVLAVLFGASRLPSMGRNVGLGITEFKKGLSEAARHVRDESEPGPAGGQERDAAT